MMKRTILLSLILTVYFSVLAADLRHGIAKERDVVVYADTSFYAAFPSVVKLGDGRLLVAFRRAPNRLLAGAERYSHIDRESNLVTVESADGGLTWTTLPRLMYQHPRGGSQDPCMLRLQNGDILCTSYLWLQPDTGKAVFAGGYLLRSRDDGATWQAPLSPGSPLPMETRLVDGEKMPLYNRGALCQSPLDGTVYWAVARDNERGGFSVYLVASRDNGVSWDYRGVIADDTIAFNETSLHITPRGDIVAFMRSFGLDDHACLARSTDGGKTFVWSDMGFQGHPLNALTLPDGRVLLTYGYRHAPYGIRARVLDSECRVWSDEIVLRDDGGGTDLGYSWPVLVDDRHVLVVYYFNRNQSRGMRSIEGTLLRID